MRVESKQSTRQMSFSLNKQTAAEHDPLGLGARRSFRFGSERPAPGALDDPSVPFWLKLHEGK
jgi:hypothetical protein